MESNNNYMKKIKPSTTYPPEIRYKYENVEYPIPNTVTYFSKTTNSERNLTVILPLNYTKDKKYPVLYLLHGLFGDEESFLDNELGMINIYTNLLDDEEAKEMIIVLPSQYIPKDGKVVPPRPCQEYFDGYDNFINDLIDNIIPFIESNYSVAPGRENRAIAGFSMGARNSLYIGYKRSDLFGYVGSFSPAPGVTPGKDRNGEHKGLLTEDNLRAEIPLIVSFISCGDKDPIVGKFPKTYHEILTRNNQENIWLEIPDASHDNKAIATGLYNFIPTLFGALE